MTHNM